MFRRENQWDNETSMNLVKLLFFRKPEEEEEQYVKVQKQKSTKRNAQPVAKSKKTEATKKPSKKTDEPRMAWLQQARSYLREVVYELRKVIWPSRKETVGSTVVVLVIVILSGVYLGIVDLLLSRVIRLIIG
jgi:preprotein translocase subunit SecE